MGKTIKMALGCFMFCSNMAMATITKYDMELEAYNKFVCASYYDYLASEKTAQMASEQAGYMVKKYPVNSQEYTKYLTNHRNLIQQKNQLIAKSNRIKRQAIQRLQEDLNQQNYQLNTESFLIGQTKDFEQGFYIAEILYRANNNVNSLFEGVDKKETTQADLEEYVRVKTCESL